MLETVDGLPASYESRYKNQQIANCFFSGWMMSPSKLIMAEISNIGHFKWAPEEARHACTNHYKFSALQSCDMSRPNALALVVIHARMSDLL